MAFNSLAQKYSRPSLMVFTETEPTNGADPTKWDLGDNYIYISDNNRAELAVSFERIEYKQRMINGTMRSYHVADKKNFSTSWDKLPSRKTQVTEYSASSNFAGGQEMLKWYEDHTGDFWMLLVYDVDSTVAATDIKKNVEKGGLNVGLKRIDLGDTARSR